MRKVWCLPSEVWVRNVMPEMSGQPTQLRGIYTHYEPIGGVNSTFLLSIPRAPVPEEFRCLLVTIKKRNAIRTACVISHHWNFVGHDGS
jgi:hypothetical protein